MPSVLRRLRLRKPLSQVQREAQSSGLKRELGPLSLMLLGIGCIIGSGIFVLTGTAAASYAGPAVLLSFIVAGFACAFAALCYAELASSLPVSGSAYTYSYTALGEGPAWLTAWLMVLEFGIAVSLVAVSFSGYFASLLRDFGINLPATLTTPFIASTPTAHGATFTTGNGVNVIAAVVVLCVTLLLVLGVALSATINAVIVVIKVSVLIAFIGVGIAWIEPTNWTPFVPENQGGFHYGWPGVLRAASMIFFAYLGFEAVSTAALEARNPQKDMPVGILGSLGVCSLIYLAVAAVLTGVVRYSELGVPDPIALAVNAMGMPWFAVLVKVGALIGLFSVMLATLYAQTRVFYAVARDGLLPSALARVSPRLRTPVTGTLLVGSVCAVTAALLPIEILSDIVSLGTALSFCVVCFCVMWLRTTQPTLERPFQVPFGGIWVGGRWLGYVPILGILFCSLMILPLIADIATKARNGNVLPALLLIGYLILGALIYGLYGYPRSVLARTTRPPDQ